AGPAGGRHPWSAVAVLMASDPESLSDGKRLTASRETRARSLEPELGTRRGRASAACPAARGRLLQVLSRGRARVDLVALRCWKSNGGADGPADTRWTLNPVAL